MLSSEVAQSLKSYGHFSDLGVGIALSRRHVEFFGDCPMFRRFYVQKVLYSEGPMFGRFYVQKVLYSEGPMFRRSYVQKNIVQKVLYSEGSMFRRSYIQIYSEGFIFRIFFVLCRKKLSVSGKLQYKITNHRL